MKAYQYVEGQAEPGAYESILQSCGNVIGCIKSWVPCIGCFLCCGQYPYVTLEQGNRGLLMRYNRYVKTVEPGFIYINPLVESLKIIDCRISVMDLPKQHLMTRDNISIIIDSCAYYHIEHPHLAEFRITDLDVAVSKVCGGIIKNTVSHFTFQELLEKREELSKDIEEQIDPIVGNWGIQIDRIFLKDFGISQDIEKQLTSAAVARRNADAKLLQAEGQVKVARLLANRSKILDTKTAIQVRFLETIKTLADNSSSSMIYNSY